MFLFSWLTDSHCCCRTSPGLWSRERQPDRLFLGLDLYLEIRGHVLVIRDRCNIDTQGSPIPQRQVPSMPQDFKFGYAIDTRS